MANLKGTLIDQIVQSCFEMYNKLPKTGKPLENEWTVLSCIVMYNKVNEEINVVSLGTGSKCIGSTKMSPKGDILNDSHAEIFARRGFMLFLFDNVKRCINKEPSIFSYENGQFKLEKSIEFIFYSSQLPCGDASIILKSDDNEQIGDILSNGKRKGDNLEIDSKKTKLDCDIYRTGAKCLPNSEQDPKDSGQNYHILGQVRTKPGRGDRTLSVSCSDKLAKWIHLGIQGSLLNILCGSIYINHFIFGSGVPYSEETLNRALLHRNSYESKLQIVPKFYQCTLTFAYIKTEENIRPAPGSIVWTKVQNMPSEVAVQGKKLGVTKKTLSLPRNSLFISKFNIYRRFIKLLSENNELKQRIIGEDDITSVPYNKMKRKATKYYESWRRLQENFFKIWTVKPDMWDFTINTN